MYVLPPKIKVNTDFKVSLLHMFMHKYKASTNVKVSLKCICLPFPQVQSQY